MGEGFALSSGQPIRCPLCSTDEIREEGRGMGSIAFECCNGHHFTFSGTATRVESVETPERSPMPEWVGLLGIIE